MFANVTKLSYHFAHEDSRGAHAQAPAGLRRRWRGRSSRAGSNGGTGCRARRSWGGRSGRRGSPSGGRCATCRRRAWSSAAPARAPMCEAASAPGALSFGLLIPDLGETEIFEPICQGMMASPLARQHALLWGSPSGAGGVEGGSRLAVVPAVHRAPRLRRVLRAARVHGGDRRCQPADRDALDAARIPVVLLDRTVAALPAPRPPRSGRHRQPPRRLRDHRACPAAGQPARRVRRHAARGRHGRCARGRLPGSVVRRGMHPSIARSSTASTRPIAVAVRHSWRPPVPTPSSAPTTAPRRA